MSQLLPQTLIRSATKFKSQSFMIPLTHRRNYSSTKAEIIEIDLSESSSSCSTSIDGPEVARKLENVMHRLLVQRSTPDWIHFVPGSSFWVPPIRHRTSESSPAGPVLDLLGKLSHPLSAEEQLSFTSTRGWPSSTYFPSGGKYTRPVDIEVEMNMENVVVSFPECDEDVEGKVPTEEDTSRSQNENK